MSKLLIDDSTAFINLIAEDKEVISYRKSLRPVTGSVTATILLQQMIWHGRKKEWDVFYKFKSPCQHELCRDGDSWTEELGFSIKEFDSALSKIGTKIKQGMSKDEILNSENPQPEHLVIYWTDANRMTWYLVNRDLLGKLLKGIYLVGDEKAFTRNVTKGDLPITETPTETPTERESVVSEPEPAQPQYPADKPTTPPPLARAESSYPSLQDMGKQPTAQERYRARGRSLKYCDDYQPKEHRAIFEAIVDAMGKRSIVDADNGKTIGDLQQAAVTLTRAGQTAQTIEAKAAGWRASFFGLRNGSAQQFMEFVATDTPQAAPQREKSANAINLAYLLENAQ